MAEATFRECLQIRPNDGPSRVFLERIQVFRRNPPGKDWNGVWQLIEKSSARNSVAVSPSLHLLLVSAFPPGDHFVIAVWQAKRHDHPEVTGSTSNELK